MKLRKHQKEFSDYLDNIIDGKEKPKNVILDVVPGGGKSFIPHLTAEKLIPDVIDNIIWFVPRTILRDQGASGSEYFVTEKDFKGKDGYVATYQTISNSFYDHIKSVENKKYVLILDEFHHIKEKTFWAEYLQDLADKSFMTIFMTGTIERGDGYRCFGLDYINKDNKIYMDTSRFKYIKYSYEDAIKEKAIIPIETFLYDSKSKWERGSETQESNTFDEDYSESIFTSITTEYAFVLLKKSLDHFLKNRTNDSGCLIICPNIKTSKLYKKYISENFNDLKVDSININTKNNSKRIDKFRKREIDVMITIAMAYEGLDVPSISHLIALTHFRSMPWLKQCISRGTRYCKDFGSYDKQKCYLFGLSDPLFISSINYLKGKFDLKRSDVKSVERNNDRECARRINPINSKLIELKETKKYLQSYDYNELRNEYDKFDGSVVEFCTYKMIPVSLGHKVLKGMNPRKLLNKKEVFDKYLDELKNEPGLKKIDFWRKHYSNFTYDPIKKALKDIVCKKKEVDWKKVQSDFEKSGLSKEKFIHSYKSEGVTKNGIKRNIVSNRVN